MENRRNRYAINSFRIPLTDSVKIIGDYIINNRVPLAYESPSDLLSIFLCMKDEGYIFEFKVDLLPIVQDNLKKYITNHAIFMNECSDYLCSRNNDAEIVDVVLSKIKEIHNL